ncbi:hypothetical protein IFT48_02520 [Pseudomonas fluorescens]|uniref:hypothetical protein n=1 Tax=Pseudomonas fluorescens TaxID=294 RepID=UPI001930D0D3|nr:hypothetical protein [Pseudomonas fluorescens]MBD8088839.1 hypothetical protein [Pseudomonas fluorescens]
MTWLFRNTPREAFGDHAAALHDLFADALVTQKLFGQPNNRRKIPTLRHLVEILAWHPVGPVVSCIPMRQDNADILERVLSIKAYFTMAVACAADGCEWNMTSAFIRQTGLQSEALGWAKNLGVHAAAPMIDATPEYLPWLVTSLAKLNNTPKTHYDRVYMTSILNGISRLKPGIALGDPVGGGFTTEHAYICRGGYLELDENTRDDDVRVAIAWIKHRRSFDTHPLNGHSAELRDLMRLMVFNAGYMLMLRKKTMAYITGSIKPVFYALMEPFKLCEDDVGFLWRRAQLCLHAPFLDYFTQLNPSQGELFHGDQIRAVKLFSLIGVHIDQMDKDISIKKGLSIVYDSALLTQSNRFMPGWCHPLDAFSQGILDYQVPTIAMLQKFTAVEPLPGLQSLCQTRSNAHQPLAILELQGGYDAWLESCLVQTPASLPAPLRIEVLFPSLNFARFNVTAQQALIRQFAHFSFSSFFKTKASYHEDRLSKVMMRFRELTDPVREAIPDFSITMIRGLIDAEVISDEIMRDLGFSGFELSMASPGVATDRIDTDTLFAKDLGL